MDEQQPTQQQAQPQDERPSGAPPRNPWDILFRIAKHTWPVVPIWIGGFFLQVWIIRHTSLKDVRWIDQYFYFALFAESALLFELFKRLLPKDWWK